MSTLYPSQPSFTTRRPVYDGDYVRGASDGSSPSSYQRYQVSVPENLNESLFISRAVGYDTIQVWWGPPANVETAWTKLAVVRSGFGYPITPADGEVIVWLDSHVDNDEVSSSVLDSDLPAGRWFYYSLLYQYNGRWYRSNTTADMVPIDYSHRDSMYELLPPFHQFVDQEESRSSSESTLRKWFDVVGYDLDYTRTLVEHVENIYDVDQAPTQFISELGKYNIGFSVEEDGIGTIRYRSLLGANRSLVDKRGTAEGLAEYVQAMTKYVSTATVGLNQLLLGDDSDFEIGVGNWAPMPYGMTRFLYEESNFDPTQVTYGQTARHGIPTRGLTLERFEDTDVLAYPTDPYTGETLPARGMLRVSADADTAMAIACGAGQQNAVVGINPSSAESVRDVVHLDPKYRGIPVDAGEIYYFSFWETQIGAEVDTNTTWGVMFFEREPIPVGPSDDVDSSTAGTFSVTNLDESDDFVGKSVVFEDGQVAFIHDRTGGDYDIYPDTYDADAGGSQACTIRTQDSCGFSDAFWGQDDDRPGFRTFGAVEPIEASSFKLFRTDNYHDEWKRHIISVESPENARFAVPFIWVAADDGATVAHTRYFTGMMFTKSQGLGVETVYQPSNYLILQDEVDPTAGNNAIGEDDGKVLGES